jgi:hypothetical protein
MMPYCPPVQPIPPPPLPPASLLMAGDESRGLGRGREEPIKGIDGYYNSTPHPTLICPTPIPTRGEECAVTDGSDVRSLL